MNVECATCSGSRLEPGKSLTRCPTCRGLKRLASQVHFTKTIMDCFTCNGTGLYVAREDECRVCDGAGTLLLIQEPSLLDDSTTEHTEERTKGQQLVDKLKSIPKPKLSMRLPKMTMPGNPFKKKEP